jgi:soluble lytic murein transglycosylase-like protein
MSDIRYLLRVVRSVAGLVRSRPLPPSVRRRLASLAFAATLLAVAAPLGHLVEAIPTPRHQLASLEQRAQHVKTFFTAIERDYDRDIAPIEKVLRTYRNDTPLVRRIAVSLVREGRRTGIEPRLLLAVLLVENPWLNPAARNETSGAQGLMQVMPFHTGKWRPCNGPLDQIEANICYGARIFAHYLGATNGDVDRALLRYNGCVSGTNTPNCQMYPYHVYARAGRASVLAWRTGVTAGSAGSR